MGNQVIQFLIAVATAVIGLAALAVLVSNRANTAGVISSATTGFSNIISAAIKPVS